MRSFLKDSISLINVIIGVTLLLFICSLAMAADQAQKKSERLEPQCGHWAILRCCEILGVPMNIKDLMSWLPPEKQGHSMYVVSKILKKIGLHTQGRRETFDRFTDDSYPIIAHMEPDHFVVVVGRDDSYVFLFDGNGRRKVWPIEEFKKRWTHKTLRVWCNTDDGPLPAFLPRRTGTRPCIQFETLLVDKGEIPVVVEGVEFIFPFCNLGKGNLVIEKIRTDCRCMESTKPEEPILPGGQGHITLKYNVEKGSGSFSHEALVQTNDPVFPLVKVTASGNNSRAVIIEPKKLDIGRLLVGKTHVTNCYVMYTGDIPLDILDVECLSSHMNFEWRILSKEVAQQYVPAIPKTVRFVGRNRRTLEISFTPGPNDIGKFEDKVYVHTNIKDFEKITVPVVAQVVPQVVLSPEILFLGDVRLGEPLEQTLMAWSPDGVPFRITKVDTADTGLQSTFSQDENGNTHISFHGKINEPSKVVDREINVLVDLLDSNKSISIKLPIYASIINN